MTSGILAPHDVVKPRRRDGTWELETPMSPTLIAGMIRSAALDLLVSLRPDAFIRCFDGMWGRNEETGEHFAIVMMAPSEDYEGEHFCWTAIGINGSEVVDALSLTIRGSCAEFLEMYDKSHGGD